VPDPNFRFQVRTPASQSHHAQFCHSQIRRSSFSWVGRTCLPHLCNAFPIPLTPQAPCQSPRSSAGITQVQLADMICCEELEEISAKGSLSLPQGCF